MATLDQQTQLKGFVVYERLFGPEIHIICIIMNSGRGYNGKQTGGMWERQSAAMLKDSSDEQCILAEVGKPWLSSSKRSK